MNISPSQNKKIYILKKQQPRFSFLSVSLLPLRTAPPSTHVTGSGIRDPCTEGLGSFARGSNKAVSAVSSGSGIRDPYTEGLGSFARGSNKSSVSCVLR